MSESKHTSGPWVVPQRYDVESEGGRLIADCCTHDFSPEECSANARLIAAAPELLSALELYGLSYSDTDLNQLAECQTGRGEIDPATAKREIIRRAAIAKAKGQP